MPDGARRRRAVHAAPDRGHVPAGLRQPRRSRARHDSAVLEIAGASVAFTTDAFVVQPAVLPRRRHRQAGRLRHGQRPGDGRGAALSPSAPASSSKKGCRWRRSAHRGLDARGRGEAGVRIVTGDTKVVDRGKGDGIFINTAGIGLVPAGVDISPARVRAGRCDPALAATSAATAWPSCRSARGCASKGPWRATAPRWPGWSRRFSPPGVDIHCLRDLTRGGLAAALNEIAADAASRSPWTNGDPRRRAGGRRLRAAGPRPALRGQRRPPRRLRARGTGGQDRGSALALPRLLLGLCHRQRGGGRPGRDAERPAGWQPASRSPLGRATPEDLLSRPTSSRGSSAAPRSSPTSGARSPRRRPGRGCSASRSRAPSRR